MIRRTLFPVAPWVIWTLALPLALGILGAAVFALTEKRVVSVDNPQLWWLSAAVPLAGLLGMYGLARRRRAIHLFASTALAPLLATRISASRPAAKAGLTVLAVGLIVAAIIGPRWGLYVQEQKVRGVDIVVALDVSRSMLADDVEPNRLAGAKRVIRQQLIERPVFQHAHRLGLIAFAGSTSLRVPLTTDHLAFLTQLDALNVGSAPRGGTAIAQSIQAAADLLGTSPDQATKIILLLTDGEDHEGGPVEAARNTYEQQGIMVFTIGVGDPNRTFGTQVPARSRREPSEGPSKKPLLHDGQIVFSKLDTEGLRQIAQAGGGRYAALAELHGLVDAIAGFKKGELATEQHKRRKPRYQWFLAVALMLLGLETFIRGHATRDNDAPRRVWQEGVT